MFNELRGLKFVRTQFLNEKKQKQKKTALTEDETKYNTFYFNSKQN